MTPMGYSVRTLVSAAMVVASAMAAQAGTVTFNFSGNTDSHVTGATSFHAQGTTYHYAEAWEQTQSTGNGDVTLRVTPGAFTRGASGTDGSAVIGGTSYAGRTLQGNSHDSNANLTQTRQGLGVMNNGTAVTDNAPYDVDGSSGGIYGTGWFDYLVLETDRMVSFDYVTFMNFGNRDSFRLLIDQDGTGAIGSTGDFLTGAVTSSSATRVTGRGQNRMTQFAPAQGLSFNRVGIAAVDEGAQWRLLEVGLRVHDDPVPPTPAPVPLPAAAWMLLAAIGGLGAMRRFARG